MHINVHYAIGVIIASISHFFLKINLFEFFMIIFCSFIIDFDVFFSKYAKDHNHRNLITHSIWPGSVLLIFGIIFLNLLLMLCGITLLIHVFSDTFDWGTNLFYTGKTIGLKLLITSEEMKNMDEILSKYKVAHSFFVFRYYNNKFCIILEILVFILMILLNIFLASEFWYFFIIYFFFLSMHMYEYKKLKKIENL